ncbi:MAG: HdeD family acid-resistance protein, partial [Methylococcales bacterium]
MRNRDNIVNELEEVHQKMLAYMQAHCRLFLFEGIFLIFLGFCAIAIPQFFSVAIIIVLGWIIVFGGVIQVSRIIFFPQIPGFGLWFVSGVLQIVVGYLLIADPIVGVLTLTMM